MPSRVSLPDIYMLQTFFPTQVVSTASISTAFKDLPTSTCKTASRTLFYTVTIFTELSKEKIQHGKRSGYYVYEEASESEVAQLCPTLCNPMSRLYSPSGSSLSIDFPGKNTGVGSSSRGPSWARDQTCMSRIAGRFFTIWATRKVPWRNKATV